jgi:hypothetical protein
MIPIKLQEMDILINILVENILIYDCDNDGDAYVEYNISTITPTTLNPEPTFTINVSEPYVNSEF